MVSHTLLDAIRDSMGLASTVTVLCWLVSGLQPQFERARDSCRACQPSEGRALLLRSGLMILIAWVAAAALYYHNLVSLWDVMGAWLESRPVNKPVYALLHIYLFFLLIGGLYALAISIFEITQIRKVYNDLLMILGFNTRRYHAVEELEAQHDSSAPDFETEIYSAVSNNVIPVETLIQQSENPTAEAVWSGIDSPVGRISTRTVYSPIRGSNAETPVGPIDDVRGNSEGTGSSNEDKPTLDSYGDPIITTPFSSSSSNASSGIDELEYVDDDDDEYDFQTGRLREPLEDRKEWNFNASCMVDQRGCVNDDHEDPLNLCYATPCLRPQDQDAMTEGQPLSIGEPPSPCESCSSAHAKSIPTAKRSSVRVPITPTSPTADAEDANTEKTDFEPERMNCHSTMSGPQIGQTKRKRVLPPSDTSTLRFGKVPTLSDDEEKTRALGSHLATNASERRARTTASAHTSGNPTSNPCPTSTPGPCTHATFPPQDKAERSEAGLSGRSREADRSGSTTASRNEAANPVSLNGGSVYQKRFGFSRRVARPSSSTISPPSRRRRRAGSPYPFSDDGWTAGGDEEGGTDPRALSIRIPTMGPGSFDGE